MALTDLEIGQLAMGHLRLDQALVDVAASASSKAELAIKRNLAVVRKGLYEDFDWSFARKRLLLTLHLESPDQPWEYLYRYAYVYPTDCAAFRRFVTIRGDFESDPPRWEAGWLTTQRVIFTEVPETQAFGEYTELLADQTKATALFEQLFALRLALAIAGVIAVEDQADILRRLYAQLSDAESRAKAQNRNEAQPPVNPPSAWLQARGVLGTRRTR